MTAPVFAPFPYPGGKGRVAARVWQELGADVYSYLEPFCGSAAVLLARPDAPGPRREVIGDRNGYVANAYRSIQWAPDVTARYAWWSTIHADLTARHRWLVEWGRDGGGLEMLMADPGYYHPKAAGWWIWGVSNWISIGDFCAAAFGGGSRDSMPYTARKVDGQGVTVNRVSLDGLHEKLPRVAPDTTGHGAAAQRSVLPPDGRPQVFWNEHHRGTAAARTNTPGAPVPTDIPNIRETDSGNGVAAGRKLTPSDGRPVVNYDTQGAGATTNRIHTPAAADVNSGPDRWIPWFRALAARLEKVYILARPWHTVLGSRSLLGDFEGRSVGVFLDPPYLTRSRAANLYARDDGDQVFPAVWQWAKEYGGRPNFRIAMCGLDGDFDGVPAGWREYRWRGGGAIGGGTTEGKPDEIIMFSPHCLGSRPGKPRQGSLL